MKCITCGKEVEIIDSDGKEMYLCEEGHKNKRIIENEGLEFYKTAKGTVHKSIGCVIIKEGKVLLLERRKFPYKFTIPAGHLEKGEVPSKAVKREVKEETNLKIDDIEKLFSGEIEDPCRRGADIHNWDLFYSSSFKGELETNDEANGYRWVKLSDLDSMNLTKPTEEFLVNKDLLNF